MGHRRTAQNVSRGPIRGYKWDVSGATRAAALVLALTCAGCVSHPVGPARTFAKYEGKAVTTAEGVLSAVQTARLVARTASKNHAFGPYLSIMTSESEDATSGLQGTFDSIQPPGARADRLRSELDRVIAAALEHLADLRVAIRRGEIKNAARTARPLARDAKNLSDFVDEHGQ